MPSILALFEASEVSAAARPRERVESIWRDTLAQRGAYVFVSDDGDRIAATCMLITVPNLLREGKGHGFLENVVSHPELRGRGHGKAVVQAALAHAWTIDCHHVLMQSGRADPGVHEFYEALGFQPGLRIAYAASRRPESQPSEARPQEEPSDLCSQRASGNASSRRPDSALGSLTLWNTSRAA